MREYDSKTVCGNAIPDDEESQKIFSSTGLCPSCYEEAMNEMHDPEGVAWEKLKKAFPGKYCTLKKEWTFWREGKERLEYSAYIDPSTDDETLKGKWGDDFPSPIEAVDDLIKKMEGV
jgi:hypothetical protein